MIVKISFKTEDQIAVYDEKNNLLKSFEIKENFQRTLQLFKKINSLKTIDNIPIYETKIFHGVSIWAFHQHVIFYNFLKDYVKYEEVIKYLFERKIKKVVLGRNIEGLRDYLRVSEIKVINSVIEKGRIRSFFFASFNEDSCSNPHPFSIFKTFNL